LIWNLSLSEKILLWLKAQFLKFYFNTSKLIIITVGIDTPIIISFRKNKAYDFCALFYYMRSKCEYLDMPYVKVCTYISKEKKEEIVAKKQQNEEIKSQSSFILRACYTGVVR
jgi:hypothetical protein